MMKSALTVLFLLALLSTGCARLEVTVSVLDKFVIDESINDELISNSMKQLAIQDSQSINSMFTDIINEHFRAYLIKIEALRKEEAAEEDEKKKNAFSESIKGFYTTFYKTIEPEYRRLQKKWEVSVFSIQDLYKKYVETKDDAEKKSYKDNLVAELRSLQAQKMYLREYLLKDLDQFDQMKSETYKQIAAQTNNKITQLFDSGGVIHSDYAYYLASAPEEEWGDPYDQSFGEGYFGNIDVAIKAIDQGNFTVKGLSFNPSDISAMAAKITTQSVILAAQIAGVPVNIKGTPQGSGAALAASSARIHAASANQAKLATQFESQRDALLKIAQAILDEADMISNGSDEQRKTSIETINAIYSAQAGRLSVSVPSEGGQE